MTISLARYEREALETLEQTFSLDREMVVGFAFSLNRLTDLCDQTVRESECEVKAGRIVMMGLLNHAHLLLIGGLQSLLAGNAAVWSACTRGLMETFGGFVLMEENPQIAPNFLESVKPGKLRAAAERAKPGLEGDIRRLHNIVHPGWGAILSGHQVVDAKQANVLFAFGLRQLSQVEGREAVTVLANMALFMVEKIESLMTRKTILGTGKVIMIRKPSDEDRPKEKESREVSDSQS
jgi:hypothetical protein